MLSNLGHICVSTGILQKTFCFEISVEDMTIILHTYVFYMKLFLVLLLYYKI